MKGPSEARTSRGSLSGLRAWMDGPGADRPTLLRSGVVVLGAGKGGVGTSTAAALLALERAAAGLKVLLVEADEHVASLPTLLGVDGPHPGLWALKERSLSPEELLVTVTPGLSLVPGGGGLLGGAAGTRGERRALLQRVSGLYERYDLVLVDGGSRLDSVLVACAQGAERLVTVSTRGRVALAGAYALVKATARALPELPVDLLLVGLDPDEAERVHETAATAAHDFLGRPLGRAGTIPFDGRVREAERDEAGLAGLPSDGPTLRAVRPIGSRMTTEFAPAGPRDVLPLPL